MKEILKITTNDTIINFNSYRYRIKIVINNLSKPFVISFQGFMSSLTKGIPEQKVLNRSPNYLEKFFSKKINYNYIYVNDLYQLWSTLDFENILKSLENVVKYYKPVKIICIGQSAGGYQSILYGNLLKVDKIIAIVPQIYIYKDYMNNFRKKLIEKNKSKINGFKYKNLNVLQPFLSKTIIFSCKYKKDISHLNNLNLMDKNLNIKYVSNEQTHDIINVLGKDELLKLVMKELNEL